MFRDVKSALTLSFLELKIKNNNTNFGFLWYFLQPLFMFLILFYVKHNVVGGEIENFIAYLLIGVVIVHFFISSTNLMMNSIVSSQNILNSMKINPKIFLLSKFFVSLWHHFFEILIVLLILIFLGHYQSFLYLLIVPFYASFIFGIGSVLSIFSLKFFDITYIWNYLCQILWFITPVYFIAHESFLIDFNPLVYFIDLSRFIAYDLDQLNLLLLLQCLILSSFSFVLGQLFFDFNKKFIIRHD